MFCVKLNRQGVHFLLKSVILIFCWFLVVLVSGRIGSFAFFQDPPWFSLLKFFHFWFFLRWSAIIYGLVIFNFRIFAFDCSQCFCFKPTCRTVFYFFLNIFRLWKRNKPNLLVVVLPRCIPMSSALNCRANEKMGYFILAYFIPFVFDFLLSLLCYLSPSLAFFSLLDRVQMAKVQFSIRIAQGRLFYWTWFESTNRWEFYT